MTKRLSAEAFARARDFMLGGARPIERALFRLRFEAGAARDVVDALGAFRNDDGGFGHALEPDLRMPGSSALATFHALRVLREAVAPADHAYVVGAVDWLLAAYDSKLEAWRYVSKQAEDHPHAFHWKWTLHADGTKWPVAILPRCEAVSLLSHYPERVPGDFLADQVRRLVEALESADESIGSDALRFCDDVVRSAPLAGPAREAIAAAIRRIGAAMVSRDPDEWGTYVAKPLKIAPDPESTLAEDLADLIAQNLDWEIDHQEADGTWSPSWSWSDAYPEAWSVAEREWRGELTLQALGSLRGYDRVEGL